jgi:hypothetical protein
VSGKTESTGGERGRQGASSGEGGWGAEELQWGALTTFIAEQREGGKRGQGPAGWRTGVGSGHKERHWPVGGGGG